MTTYTISYDLIKRKDYPKLWEELGRLGAFRTLESYWLISLNNTAKEVHDHFRQFVDADDRIFVAELVKNYWYSQALGGTNEWLAKNPPAR